MALLFETYQDASGSLMRFYSPSNCDEHVAAAVGGLGEAGLGGGCF